MLSTRNEPGIAVYPDSNKVGAWPPGKLFRIDDAVDYWDGETTRLDHDRLAARRAAREALDVEAGEVE